MAEDSACPSTGYDLSISGCVSCDFSSGLNQIGGLARELVEYEFSYITGEAPRKAELYTISGSLSGSLGELNILLNQSFCYTGCDGDPNPRLGLEEGEILQQIYLRDYNVKQAQKTLRGLSDPFVEGSVATGNVEWIELSEGDTTIRRSPGSLSSSAANRITMSKDFRALSEAAKDKIKELVYAYNMYGAQPRQIAGDDAPISGSY
jgi:hypothetical protein